MMISESILKTKKFFHKTLQNFKSFCFERYKKLPETPLCNPFSCSTRNLKNHQTDQYYTSFCDEWESDLAMETKKKKNGSVALDNPIKEEKEEGDGNLVKNGNQSPVKIKQENGPKVKSKIMGSANSSRRENPCSQNVNGGGNLLAKKMKEFEMMDVGNVEQVLDIEEALHYYSRLRSPAYVDIVDKFFVDMYSDFSVPQPSASINSSKRRLGSIRL